MIFTCTDVLRQKVQKVKAVNTCFARLRPLFRSREVGKASVRKLVGRVEKGPVAGSEQERQVEMALYEDTDVNYSASVWSFRIDSTGDS